jgi:hypothetical protein
MLNITSCMDRFGGFDVAMSVESISVSCQDMKAVFLCINCWLCHDMYGSCFCLNVPQIEFHTDLLLHFSFCCHIISWCSFLFSTKFYQFKEVIKLTRYVNDYAVNLNENLWKASFYDTDQSQDNVKACNSLSIWFIYLWPVTSIFIHGSHEQDMGSCLIKRLHFLCGWNVQHPSRQVFLKSGNIALHQYVFKESASSL